MTRSIWRRLIALGFRLLYKELAWLYDPVSWITSFGRWRRWQESALPYLPPSGRVLEVGFGPGHLLVALARAGYAAVGLDISPAMHRLARRRLRRRHLDAGLCRGRAESLPFAGRAFDAIVLTFPTPFVYGRAWLRQLGRVLRVPGRLIVVEMATFESRSLPFRLLEWLYQITGQRGPTPDLPHLLGTVGLCARRETVVVDGTSVGLIVAEWREDVPSALPVGDEEPPTD